MKKTADAIKAMKGKEKIAMLTAYDYSAAKYQDEAGIDMILIGDSLGMVVLGYENVLSVTMSDMQRHTAAVARGTANACIVSDMPIGSFDDPNTAYLNAESLIKLGADAVKIENRNDIAKHLIENQIPVQGHVGLTPQTATEFKVQGKDKDTANKIIREAKSLDEVGCFSIVLECIPVDLAKKITKAVSCPTIGIGAGVECDGQVLVSNDMLGIYDKLSPKFVKKYASLGEEMKKAFEEYVQEVKGKKFPEDKHSFH